MSNKIRLDSLIHQLPLNIKLAGIRALVRLQSGLDNAIGETYLLVHLNDLVVMTRASAYDRYNVLNVVAGSTPRLEEGTFRFATEEGERVATVLPTETGPVLELLSTLTKARATA